MNLIVWHSQGFGQEPLNQQNWDKDNEISDRISHRNPDRIDRDYGLEQRKQVFLDRPEAICRRRHKGD
jgi:hypothetical protein